MKTTPGSEHISSLDKLVFVCPKNTSPINAVLLYEDESTRQWARNAHDRVARLAGRNGVRPTWWKLSNLSEPGVLAAAASTAMRADVVVVATQATEGLPLPFYVWIKQWTPHRLQPGGVLLALLGKPRTKSAKSGRVGDYLRSAANQSRMSFLLDQPALAADCQLSEKASIRSQNGHNTSHNVPPRAFEHLV
jgi:hypothetical protein